MLNERRHQPDQNVECALVRRVFHLIQVLHPVHQVALVQQALAQEAVQVQTVLLDLKEQRMMIKQDLQMPIFIGI